MNCKKIKIIGVGGTGINVVELMLRNNMPGVECVVVDTDAETLEHSSASIQLQLGDQGTGSTLNPEYARKLAEHSLPKIAELLQGADIVIVTAGFGKGTGTGAFPTIAKAAKLTGASVLGIIGMPFSYTVCNAPFSFPFNKLAFRWLIGECLVTNNSRIRVSTAQVVDRRFLAPVVRVFRVSTAQVVDRMRPQATRLPLHGIHRTGGFLKAQG